MKKEGEALISNDEIINLKDLVEKETGKKFNNNNMMCCPIHSEKSPSFSVKKYSDKWRYCCFACGCSGDAIDFIKSYKHMNYIEACKYLNVNLDKDTLKIISNLEKVEKYIKWQLENTKNGYELITIHSFVDKTNNVIYYKAKFKKPDGKKETPYYHIERGKVINTRGYDEIPYNLYNLTECLAKEKNIFICEGEKDCDTLIHFGYVATSFKGVKEFDYSIFKNAIVYIIPDTGETGEKYKDNLYYQLKDYVKEFNVIYPRGLNELGNNKDITDWFQSGKTLSDFKATLNDKWDYKLSRFWRDINVKITNKGETIVTPKKTSWRNIEQVLNFENVHLKYNLINKEAEATGSLSSSGDLLIIDIQTMCLAHDLEVKKETVCDAILKISRMNQYNPFFDYLKVNRNSNHQVIEDVFNCIIINSEFAYNREIYLKYFNTWLMDLVTMAQNTIEKGLKSQGVLVLQGKQGGRKSTFFKKLINNSKWFKGECDVDPKDKDSVIKITKYIFAELSELDGMTKKDQDSMKRFLTDDIDTYRVPYGRCTESHPRITTFCATVNPRDFLKDRTGSRRFWVIPIEKCNIPALEHININEFWGAVYDLWCTGTVKNYLNENETEILLQDNTAFNSGSDISIAIDEKFDFNQNKIAWKTYNLGEISEKIGIDSTKAIRNELEIRGFKYQAHRDNYLKNDKTKKGFKLPNLDIKEAERLERDMLFNPFPDKLKEQQTFNEIKPKEPVDIGWAK